MSDADTGRQVTSPRASADACCRLMPVTPDRYCEMQHLVVSLTADPHGFIDEVLAKQGHTRRIALTVPNFMLALAVIAETDLVSALPRQLAATHAARFGVVSLNVPLPLGSFRLNAVAPKVAMMDMGLTWLFDVLERAEDFRRRETCGPSNTAREGG